MSPKTTTRALWLALAGVTVALAGISVARTRGAPSPAWRTDLGQALRLARNENRPLVVFFTAEWCPWCARMDRGSWTDRDVLGLARQYVAARVDTDKHPDLMRRYNVEALPTTVVLAPTGKLRLAVRGYAEADGLARALRDGLARTK